MRRSLAKFRVAIAVASIMSAGCDNEKQLFRKLEPEDSGVTFENRLSPTDDFNIIDYIYFYNGGGVAIGDINGDELPELFFSGNQVPNKLYLNKGNLEFDDITALAGVAGSSSWKTGAVMGDVNGDGLLDIYVCAVVGIKNLNGHNELFINNGDNTFSEKSAQYGLDFESYSSSAAFLDYDRDGDLDLYLLNHAIHTPAAFGYASQRNVRTYESGGKLLRNDGERFVDVSEQAKIYGGVNGYGLGVSVADFNLDGYPDIYVGNDFHEDDYYYVNNRDGTFSEQGKQAMTCTSKFSMGNDAADINHDGYPDLISLDMLPEDEAVLKRSVDEENMAIMKIRTGKYGYHYQFPRNMLQINQGNGKFAETALMSNVAATDWSWSALFCDFDLDGHQDLFVSNGIPRRPNDLDYIKYVSSEQVVHTIGNTKIVDQKALAMMPSGSVRNYIFRGSGSLQFEDKSKTWLPDVADCSTAAAVGDLDNDGDLEVVVNNIDDTPGIYINQSNGASHYLKIRLRGSGPNAFGIGTKVYSYHQGVLQMKEMYTVRGFQSSSEPVIHFGYGQSLEVDSLFIVWPDGSTKKFTRVKTNQTLAISPKDGVDSRMPAPARTVLPLFRLTDPDETGIAFEHREDPYTDFDRLKLLPFQQSDRGPATAIGDINNDGRPDIYFGGSKRIAGKFFVQSETGFHPWRDASILKDSIKEDVDAVIAEFNDDGKSDLFIGTGGADFYNKSQPLLDSYYQARDSGFTLTEISGYYENASCVKAMDFDADGDPDLFVGNGSVSNDYGKVPPSYLLRNENGRFTPYQTELFETLGMVTDAVWEDYDGDGRKDLVVVGEWMAPLFLKNNDGVFERDDILRGSAAGLWQSVLAFDIDRDRDLDYLVGNWGLNSRFRASRKHPMRMYYNDFDKDGKPETVIAIAKNGTYYPLEGYDVLAGQIATLRKRFTTYKDFAGKPVEDLFTPDELEGSVIYEVDELASGYLRNDGGAFEFVRFPDDLQISPLMAMVKHDFDSDGNDEVLVAGNYFGVQPFHGRYGSFSGAIVKSGSEILPGRSLGLDLINRSVRHLNVISHRGREYLLVTVNNDKAQVYEIGK